MSIQAATPYFMFNGKTAQAVALYQRALGAKVETMQRFGDVDGSCPDALKDRVMHAALRVGSALLMMSDGPSSDAAPPDGGNVNVALEFNDAEAGRRAFDALAASGTVIQPLIDAPWGGLFGVVRDELGIPWMFNCTTKPS